MTEKQTIEILHNICSDICDLYDNTEYLDEKLEALNTAISAIIDLGYINKHFAELNNSYPIWFDLGYKEGYKNCKQDAIYTIMGQPSELHYPS